MKLRKLIKKIINEEISKLKNRSIFLNPKHLNDSPQYVRGIINTKGDIYVMNHSFSHAQIALILFSNDLIPFNVLTDKTLKYIIPVEKTKDDNNFYLSQTYSQQFIENNVDKIEKILTKCRDKNPTFRFFSKRAVD